MDKERLKKADLRERFPFGYSTQSSADWEDTLPIFFYSCILAFL
jgi:hypothetical protein